jgi:hypothetical protein
MELVMYAGCPHPTLAGGEVWKRQKSGVAMQRRTLTAESLRDSAASPVK